MSSADHKMHKTLLKNVHEGLPPPGNISGETVTVRGDYLYYHYVCDGTEDRGWGCAYRTLQSLCSWVHFQQKQTSASPRHPPTIADIQKALVEMQDKPASFAGSKDWIGSVEVGLCIDYFYDVPCKIVHINSGSEIPDKIAELTEHYRSIGSPVMMGEDTDNSSKGIFGVCGTGNDSYLLIVDPHYHGTVQDPQDLQQNGWVKWQHVRDFKSDSFYNFCLPLYKQ
ncbi:PREDICTED: ufm1-specific protease 1-like isoform X1 [Branchiostoma belcheri]|uniref:Ufm1-specific protease 1-like isoform X1 n=2 Tax=Branchiostoma belcheri TaxID=7741 RepID=A0A6P4YAE0_BRABE|nr:PREDICTED: ufm1-specific protease 1-like isoform X1 [Branchiostoma belcheri]